MFGPVLFETISLTSTSVVTSREATPVLCFCRKHECLRAVDTCVRDQLNANDTDIEKASSRDVTVKVLMRHRLVFLIRHLVFIESCC